MKIRSRRNNLARGAHNAHELKPEMLTHSTDRAQLEATGRITSPRNLKWIYFVSADKQKKKRFSYKIRNKIQFDYFKSKVEHFKRRQYYI